MDEGYIKYNCIWTKCDIEVSDSIIDELNEIRSNLVKKGMIGKIPDGPGFGNISIRHNRKEFFITGTNTGHLAILEHKNIALVTKATIKNNEVWCNGFSQASSESLSHAAIYETLSWVNAVIHIHHKPIWQNQLNKLPTTGSNVAYGTVEMAEEIKKKLEDHSQLKLLVLGGHEDGLISYGKNLKDAFDAIENLFHTIN